MQIERRVVAALVEHDDVGMLELAAWRASRWKRSRAAGFLASLVASTFKATGRRNSASIAL